MLKQRILTALAIGPASLVLLFTLTGAPFACFVGVIVVLSAWEWANLSGVESPGGRTLYTLSIFAGMLLAWAQGIVDQQWSLWVAMGGWWLAAGWVFSYPSTTWQWRSRTVRMLMGVVALLPCWIALCQLRETPWWLLYVLFIIWGADISAYFAGRAFGRHTPKLAPSVSPGKSWAGVYGGLAGATLLAMVMVIIQQFGLKDMLTLMAVTWVVTLASVMGDLFESMLKRHRGIKDSSGLLPGHGGVLDRIDSLTAAVPLFTLLAPWVGH